MSTYSTNLRLELITTGTQAGNWGNTTNTNLGTLVEQAITGNGAITIGAGTSYTLTAYSGSSDESRNASLTLSTASQAFTLFLPAVPKLYVIYNNSGYTATIYNTGYTTGPAIPTGYIMAVWSNGTSVYQASTYMTSPTFVTPALGTPASGNLSSCTANGTDPVGYKNIPQSGSAKVASYTLVASDVGKVIVLGSSGTIVIPASIFAVGDAISVFNNTSGTITNTCSAITTVYKSGVDSNISSTGFGILTRGVVTILFVTATTVVLTGSLS